MPQVAPEDPNAFPRTIKHTNVSGYTPEYLAAKSRVTVGTCTVTNDVKISYFTDGDPDGVPVLCLHGGSEGKYMWLQKEPLPGIFQISIDRPGYGESDSPQGKAPDYPFEMVVKDICLLADHLKIDQFVVCGFSIGSSWAQQLACAPASRDRVRGIIVFGCMADTGHPKMTAALAKKVGKPPKVLDPNDGCLGFVLRGAFSGPMKQFQNYDFSAKMGPDSKSRKCAPRFKQWTSDAFWICCSVDAGLAYNRTFGQMQDAYRTLFQPWQYDVSTIKCPVYNFQGEHECAERLEPHASLSRLLTHPGPRHCAARTWALRHRTHRNSCSRWSRMLSSSSSPDVATPPPWALTSSRAARLSRPSPICPGCEARSTRCAHGIPSRVSRGVARVTFRHGRR